jgi:hypothetical protein
VIPDETYVQQAAACGLVRKAGNVTLVADRLREPLSGESRCFIEYCDPAGYRSAAALQETVRYIREEFPGVAAVVLRVRDGSRLPAPWRPLITYVRYAGPAPPAARTSSVAVRVAEESDRDLVRHWIEAALTAGYARQAIEVPGQPGIRSAAGEILNAPGRISLVGLAGGEPVGHATLLDGFDDVTAEEYVDLFDVLVETHDQQHAVRAALVEAAVRHSKAVGRPLIGNVTHSLTGPDELDGLRILDGLVSHGWRIDQADWWSMPR